MNVIFKFTANNLNKNFNLLFKKSFHNLTTTTNKHLFDKATFKNLGTKFSKPKQSPSCNSNFLLIVRRIGTNSRLNINEIPKRKVDPKELRRLIGLAKPEKYSLIGTFFILPDHFTANACL